MIDSWPRSMISRRQFLKQTITFTVLIPIANTWPKSWKVKSSTLPQMSVIYINVLLYSTVVIASVVVIGYNKNKNVANKQDGGAYARYDPCSGKMMHVGCRQTFISVSFCCCNDHCNAAADCLRAESSLAIAAACSLEMTQKQIWSCCYKIEFIRINLKTKWHKPCKQLLHMTSIVAII